MMKLATRECEVCGVVKNNVVRMDDDDLLITVRVCSQCCNNLWKRKEWLVPEVRQYIGKIALHYIHMDVESKEPTNNYNIDTSINTKDIDWSNVNTFSHSHSL